MLLGSDTITVINDGDPTGYDGVGDPKYGDPTLTVVNGCSVQEYRLPHREIALTDVSTARYRVFAPASAPLNPTSIVVMGSVTWPLPDGTQEYLVDGQPNTWRSRFGVADHIEFYVKAQVG